MKRYVILMISICNLICHTQAQQVTNFDTIRGEIDTLFSKLEKERIPTGLLLDNAIEYVNIRDYDGQQASNEKTVNLSTFLDILKTINSASVHGEIISQSQLPVPASNIVADNTNNIHLYATLYRYNYIRSNVLEDNCLSFDGKYIYDVYENGIWKNPYNEGIVFAMTSNYIASSSSIINFSISIPLAFRNTVPKAVYFDADNGMGYRLVTNILNLNTTIIYNNDGLKKLKLKVELQNGQILETHCHIYINLEPQITQLSTELPSFTIEDNGQIVAEVFYDTRNISGNHCKPFIIVEGFDPWELINYNRNGNKEHPTYSNLKVYNGHTTYNNIPLFFSNNILSNYNLFYVDWYNSTLDIKQNAEYLIQIINRINEQKRLDGSTELNVIMGQSMGGLIARYALCKMEREGNKHEVATYISHDSPHLGANIPLGAQYFITQLLSFAGGYTVLMSVSDLIMDGKLSEAEEIILDILHSKAAQQMLINYLNTNGVLDNSCHLEWQNTLEEIGFPKGDDGFGIEKLAIVNGMEFIPDNNYVNNKHLLKIDGYATSSFWSSLFIRYIGAFCINLSRLINLDFLLYDTFLPGNSEIRLTAEVNPYISYSNNNTLSKLNLHYTKYFYWIKSFKLGYDIFNSHAYSPTNYGIACDNYNGSYYYLNFPEYNVSNSGWAGSYGFNLEHAKNTLFIPTTSALAMGEYVTDTDNDNIYSDTTLIEKIPFDAYCFTNNASDIHINIDKDEFDWIHEHLCSYISGPDFIKDCGDFHIEGVDKQVHWKVSDESIATIDYNSGHLTALKGGTVIVEAYLLDNGKLYRKTKKVTIDFPNFAITKKYAFGQGYRFTASIINEQDYEEFKELVDNGTIKYEWYIIDSNNNLTTYTDIGDTLYYEITEDEIITVGLKLVFNENIKSEIKTITLNLQTPFEINYKYVVVSRSGMKYYIKSDDTYDINIPNEDLAITFRNILLDQTDNSFSLFHKYIGGANCYLVYSDYANCLNPIIKGTKIRNQYKWVFPFYDTEVFTQSLTDAFNFITFDQPTIISDFNMSILNSNYEIVQNTPFAILYNPNFP